MAWTPADRDRVRAELAAIVARFPGSKVEDAYGHTGFSAGKKRFAWLLVDHHGDGRLAVCIKAPLGELEELVAADPTQYFVPAYLGANGWVGVDLDPEKKPDWSGVAALMEQGWRMSATKRAIAELDASRHLAETDSRTHASADAAGKADAGRRERGFTILGNIRKTRRR